MKLSRLIISTGIIVFVLISRILGIYLQNTCLTAENTEMNVFTSGPAEPVLYRGDIAVVEKNPCKLNVGDNIYCVLVESATCNSLNHCC